MPVDLDGLVVVMRGTNKALFGRARREHFELLAASLDESLATARRETKQYRVGGVEPPGATQAVADDPTTELALRRDVR